MTESSGSRPTQKWLDAVVILDGEGKPTYPALLGTGGNDGRLDFTNNFMRRLAGLLDTEAPRAPARPDAPRWLAASLDGTPTWGLPAGTAGQLLPAEEGQLNPWDLVLALEGAVAFRLSLTRRVEHGALAGGPFTARGEGRGEQWMPLWSRPATWPEVQAVISAGPATAGATEMALALTSPFSFPAYAYLERNGRSYLAVPLERWRPA